MKNSVEIYEVYNIYARAFYLIVCFVWCAPLLFLSEMPGSAKLPVIILVATFFPVFAWRAIGRRVVQIDPLRRLLIVRYGILVPFFRRIFSLDDFDRLVVREKRAEFLGDDGLEGATVYHKKSSCKISVGFYFTGKREILIHEMSRNQHDQEFEKRISEVKRKLSGLVGDLL